jgi:iron complex outermembrane receptor protein
VCGFSVAKEAHGDLEDKKGNPRDDLIRSGDFFAPDLETFIYFTKEKEKRAMKRWRIGLFLGMFFSGFLITGVYAEEKAEDVTLETVVVTGTRTEQKVERIPANVTVIDQEDIKNSNAKNIPDILRSEEGIVVRDLYGTGKKAQVDLRGFGETGPYNTLVLVDGRRVNEIDLSGSDWTQIPLEQIERVEIVRGTGSVLFGDNASGGVINIITKVPSEELTCNVETIFGSYSLNKEMVSISGREGNIGASLFASYDSSDGYRENSESRTKDIGGKIVFDPTDNLSLNLSGSYQSDSYGLPGALTKQEMDDDRRSSNEPYNGADGRDWYLKMGIEADFGEHGSLIADVSYRDNNSEEEFVSFNYLSKRESETWAVTPRYVWDGEIFNLTNTLIVGVDLYWSEYDVNYYAGIALAPNGFSEIEKDTQGFYFNNEISLMENLFFSLGARHEKAEYDLYQKDLTGFYTDLDDSETERENAYSAGLTFQYAGQSSVFIRANRSFRFPLTDELILFDWMKFPAEIRVNDIKTQRGKHYEIGVKHFFSPDIQANVTLFRAKIKDEIFFNPYTFENTNHPETLHYGVEVGGKARLWENLTVFGNYTYDNAEFNEDPFDNNNVPAVPRHRGNLGFRIHDIVPGLIFSSGYNFVSASYAISDQANAFEKLDKYYSINARLSYEWRWLKSFVGVNNLTGKEYSEYAVIGGFIPETYYYPAPERNWVAGLEIAF